MVLPKKQDMIQALAAEAAEEALADRVQVGRPGWDRDHVNIRAGGGRGEVAPELAIVGPDPEPRCAVVRRSLSELLSDPRIGRGAGDVDVDDLAGPVGDEKERVDRADPGVVGRCSILLSYGRTERNGGNRTIPSPSPRAPAVCLCR